MLKGFIIFLLFSIGSMVTTAVSAQEKLTPDKGLQRPGFLRQEHSRLYTSDPEAVPRICPIPKPYETTVACHELRLRVPCPNITVGLTKVSQRTTDNPPCGTKFSMRGGWDTLVSAGNDSVT
jgi:hypothetical protein